MPDPLSPDRLDQLEMEISVLRAVVARLAAFADPKARVAVVQMLTNAPTSLPGHQTRSAEGDMQIRQAARALLSRIAG